MALPLGENANKGFVFGFAISFERPHGLEAYPGLFLCGSNRLALVDQRVFELQQFGLGFFGLSAGGNELFLELANLFGATAIALLEAIGLAAKVISRAVSMPTSSSLLTLLVRQTVSPLGLQFMRPASIRSLRPSKSPADCGPCIPLPPEKTTML